MRALHFTTGTGTPALTYIGNAVALLGMSCAVGEALFIKFWWAHNTSTEIPVIGTTVPDLTIQVPATGLLTHFNFPLQGGGPCWYAVTKNVADTDDTALTSGGDVITLFLD